MNSPTNLINQIQKLLPQNNSSPNIYTVSNQLKDIPMKDFYQLFQQHNFLPYRSAHLGSTWKAITENFHIGTGVFHASSYNVSPAGNNLILLDFNLVPSLIDNQFLGDTLWWPGYSFKHGQFHKLNLFCFNPQTQQLVPTSTHQLHLQTHLFLEDKTPLNNHHLQQLHQLGKTEAKTYSQIFNQHKNEIEQIINQLITSDINLKLIVNRSVSWEGITQATEFNKNKNGIVYQNYQWTYEEFAQDIVNILTLTPTDNFSTRTQSLQQIYNQKNLAPLPSKELQMALLSIFTTHNYNQTYAHFHSGGYDMAGARPFNHGYMYQNHLRKFKKTLQTTIEALNLKTPFRFNYFLLPATNFALGSYNPKDIHVLDQLINDYQNIPITFSKQTSPKVNQLITDYASKLSHDFWRNFTPMNYQSLPLAPTPSFKHPSNLLNLTFAQANYLVGHFRLLA